jgi:hypothetical protein
MKTLLALTAGALTSAVCAFPAHASCTDPRNPSLALGMPHVLAQVAREAGDWKDHESHRSIVGTWDVTYTAEGNPNGEAFIQWHSDGTEWENINFPVLSGNICMGSWKMLDATHVFRRHVGWLYDTGALVGYFHETETDELSKDGNSYTGNNETKLYDLNGNMFLDVKGTASATRISP